MALTAADVLIETVQDWGVEVVFGLPGDGIIQACGYAKFTGKLGVCLATSGPGGRMLEEALEPPLPAKSLLRGEPNSQKIALTVLGDRIRELV